MGSFMAFLYGWMCGIIAVVLCILYGFDTLLLIMRFPRKVWSRLPFGIGMRESALGNAADYLQARRHSSNKATWLAAAKASKRSLREQGLEGVVAETPSDASQLKLASTCWVSWHEDGISGAPIRCRFVLAGAELTIYELLPSAGRLSALDTNVADAGEKRGDGKNRGDSNDRDTASAEHLRGVTEVARLHVKLVKGVPKDKTRPGNPFIGRVLVLNTLDGLPLLGAATSASGGGGFGAGGARRRDPSRSPHRSPADQSLAGDTADGAVFSPATPRSRPSATYSTASASSPFGATRLSQRGMGGWSTVVVKFRDNRETERWHNILHGLRDADAWREFAKTLPNPDPANALISRFLFQNMSGDGLAKAITKQIQKKLKKVSITKFPRDLTGEIMLDDFVIGKAIPWISDVSAPTVSTNGEFGFNFNLHYKAEDEGFTLFFRLALAYRDIRIPHVIVSLKLHELEGTVHVSIGPPPSKKFWIGGCQPPALRVEVHQGCALGHGLLHRILTSLPDLSGIITNLLKLFFISHMVLPYMDDFPIPNFDKTPKTSRSASPKTRVFDRKRAAQKSAAPDLPFAMPATSVSVAAVRGAADVDTTDGAGGAASTKPEDEEAPPSSPKGSASPTRSSLHANASSTTSPPRARASEGLGITGLKATRVLSSPMEASGSRTGDGAASGTGYALPAAFGARTRLSPGALNGAGGSSTTGGPSSPIHLSSSLTGGHNASSSVNYNASGSNSNPVNSAGLPLWANAVRRGTLSGGVATSTTDANCTASFHASRTEARGTLGGDDALSKSQTRATTAAGGGGGGGGGGSGGSVFAATEVADDAATIADASNRSDGGADGTRKARKSKLNNLRTALKSKGVDMGRASVAKADK